MPPKISKYLAQHSEYLLRFAAVLCVVALAWTAFLDIQEEINARLIMIWLSALLVLVALNPQIIGAVKKLKISEFEIELKDAVGESTPDDYLAIEQSQGISSQKTDFPRLAQLLRAVALDRSKPVLLIVNV